MWGSQTPSGVSDMWQSLTPAGIFRKFGTDAHVWIPGVGSLNGVQAGNWLESAGTTPATIDGLVGKVNDTFGGIHATQATTANKPILRRGAVNLLLNSTTLSTQNVTVPAVPMTLHFQNTGTITLSGASTAGPLIGTDVSNRVSITFTPTAGTLTLTVTGTVSSAQLEVGSVATPYIPTTTAPASSGQGLSYWQFDGVNDYLSLGAVPFQMSDDHAIIACANARILNSRDILSIGSTLSANPLLRLGVQAGNYADFFSRDDANVSVELIGTSVILGSNAVIAAIKINNSRALRVNAVQEASSNTAVGASSVTVSAVGCRAIATPSAFWNGSIYCVIAIKGTVSDAELKILERWAGLFGGVTI